MHFQSLSFSSFKILYTPLLTRLFIPFLTLFLSSCQISQKKTEIISLQSLEKISKIETSSLREQALKESKGKVRVALLLPLSGPQAELGQAMLNAAQMSVFDNANNELELLIHDTKGEVLSAAQAAKAALDNGAQIILGPLFYKEAQQIAPQTIKSGVPVLSFSNNQEIAGNGIFALGFNPEEQIQRLMNIASTYSLKRIAALLPASPYGQMLQRALDKYSKQESITLATINPYAPGATDFSLQAQQIRTFHPQALLICEGSHQLQEIVSSLLYSDIDLQQVKLLGTGQWDTPEIIDNEAVIGGWFVGSPPEKRRRFEDDYQSIYKKMPPRLATLAYDAISLTAVLIHNQISNPFQRHLLTQPRGFAGIDGLFRLLPDGRVERKLAILEVTRHGLITVSPAAQTF